MGSLKKIVRSWWFLSLLCLVLFILIFVVLLPLVVAELRPWSVRLIWGAAAAATWVGIASVRLVRRRGAARRIAESLRGENLADGEHDVLVEKMRAALTALRASNRAGDYLYSQPWYVIIGSPGVGKTTALLNSGLHFLSDVGVKANLGGTRNIQFLFADEAVLIDTAGRYTSQDSDSVRDRRAWQDFLALLIKNRPLQPINGVIVAFALDQLAKADAETLDRHAEIIRQRLKELHSGLAVNIPVYLVFTKSDLMVGFTEYFDDMDAEGRRAVLGVTLPWSAQQQPSAQDWAAQFDTLFDAIQARMSKRLQDERDSRRRGLILDFPPQISAMRSRILYLLRQVHPEDDPAGGVWMRGFYFTSGLQEGTPFDRVLGHFATLSDAAPAPGRHGRAYFINRLLKEVMFTEAGLVQRTSGVVARDRRRLAVGLGATAAVFLVLIALWTSSFLRNRAFQNDQQVQATMGGRALRDSGIDLSIAVDDSSLLSAVPVLHALRRLPGGYEDRHGGGGHSWLMEGGLYRSSLSEKAEMTYRDTLQRIMLPRLLLRLEDRLRSSDVETVYNALKVYLMLGQQHPIDRSEVEAWVAQDWQNGEFQAPELEAARSELGAHLSTLLSESDLGALWAGGRVPLDGALIQRARSKIEEAPADRRAYAILKARITGPDWTVGGVLAPGDGRAFANGDAFLRLRVPYLFTRTGYLHGYLSQLASIQTAMAKDAVWIFGEDRSRGTTGSELSNLATDVNDQYGNDYIRVWKSVLSAMRPADYLSDTAALAKASGPRSPIKLILQKIDENTQLMSLRVPEGAASKLKGYVGRLSRYVPDVSSGGRGGGAADKIRAAFRDLHAYLEDKSLDVLLQKLREVSFALAAKRESRMDNGDLGRAMQDLKVAAQSTSGDMSSFGQQVSGQAEGARKTATKLSLDIKYATVREQCTKATQNVYPFQVSDRDAQMGDLNEVFGSGGVLENFIHDPDGLAPLLDTTTGSIWHWRATDISTELHDFTAGQFQKAEELHQLLVDGLQMQTTAAEWGGDTTAADLSLGGAPYHFDKTQPSSVAVLRWNINQTDARIEISSGSTPSTAKKTIGPASGNFALFRLFDQAKLSSTSANAFDAKFGDDLNFVKLHVTLLSGPNAFGRPGRIWSFKCPSSL